MSHVFIPESRVSFSRLWINTRRMLEMIRFSHTVFALPFALFAACLAWKEVPFRLQHLFGIILAWVFLDEQLMPYHVTGIVLILCGIWLTSRYRRARRDVEEAAIAGTE